MICPQCKNEVTGKWCTYCGTKLEPEDTSATLHPTQGSVPEQSSASVYGYTKNDYRDESFNSDSDIPDKEYISPEDAVNPYGNYYNKDSDNSNKNKLIIIISILVVLIIAAGFVVVKFMVSGGSKNGSDVPVAGNSVIADEPGENSKIKSLTQKGETYMRVGDYEEAEEIYDELCHLTDDEETVIVYDILFNYNRAVAKLNGGDYESAKKYYNKIPDEYVDYDISSDVEDLQDNIKKAKSASAELENIREYIKNEEYGYAREAINAIDSTYFSAEQKEELSTLTKKLEDAEEEKNTEKDLTTSYSLLNHTQAQDLISAYCSSLVSAINNNNFYLVEPFILSSSPLYNQQKNLVASCSSQGITEQLVSAVVNKLTQLSGTKWEASVTETENIFYADGTQKQKTFNWVYTIEYVNNEFFVTGIK